MNGVEERSSKRRRLDTTRDQDNPQKSFETADQIYYSLQFRKNTGPEVKTAINRFKDFLTNISKSENLADQSKHLRILKQYCDAQSAPSKDEVDFPDLISTWSHAAESNHEPICSAVPAVLAQFYKTISSFLEFRDFGLSLGHSLLKREQVRLLDRGLSVSKTKDYLISPCLRLLTEIVSFDGGALAARTFDRRDVLFKRLDVFLESQGVAADSDRRKPSLRRMALRLVIAGLKFFEASSKVEFITHGKIWRNLLRGLTSDGDDIVRDVLKAIDGAFLEDRSIPRPAKSRLFSQENLSLLAELYNYEHDPNHPDAVSSVREAVQDLLLKICTTKKGVVLSQSGWYPVAFDATMDIRLEDDYIDLGLDSPLLVDEYNSNIPVRNSILSAFAQTLRPESDTLHSALLLQILQSAPELIAEYFSRKNKLIASSGEDAVWRSQFAFLFSIVQMPIPANFGWQDGVPFKPPPVTIAVESIMPRLLGRATLSKYLTSNEEVLILSAARLLVITLRKLREVMILFARQGDSLQWSQASAKIVESVLQRVPKLQEIINSLQRSGKTEESIKLALFECLAVYHQTLPEATVGSKFDIGATLMDLFSRFPAAETNSALTETFSEQILHAMTVADLSHATKWWAKRDTDTLTLFGQCLRVAIAHSELDIGLKMLKTLKSVAATAGFLDPLKEDLPFIALCQSLRSAKRFQATDETWLMLDTAMHRSVQMPVRYLDQIEAIQHTVSDTTPLSLLAAAVAEQWEFVVKKHASEKSTIKNVAEWITRFYGALEAAGENYRVMGQLQNDMLQLGDDKTRSILQKAINKGRKMPVNLQQAVEIKSTPPPSDRLDRGPKSVDLTKILGNPSPTVHSLDGIDRWDSKTDVELAVQSGKIARLLRCLGSSEEEIRRQAFLSLQEFAYILEQSSYEESVQVHLLLGEMIQTVRAFGLVTPFPSVATELAVSLLTIVADPTSAMYGKANKFLLRSPSWELKRLVGAWMGIVLFQESESEEVGAWAADVEWLLRWLINGLQTEADMEMYRRGGVFEKMLTVYSKLGLPRSIRKLLLTLVWHGVRAGGANTLVTRVGIQDWLQMVGTVDKEHRIVSEQLASEIDAACDKVMTETWRNDIPILRAAALEVRGDKSAS